MLKPIKTFGLKKLGSQMNFAQRIMERAAKFGGYELSEGELVFAVGAAREREDLMSVLELMDELLGLMRRGFDKRASSLAVKLVNNIEIILNKGGYSRAYFNTVEIYGRIAAVSGGSDDLGAADITKLRAEIQQQRELLRNSGGGRSSRTSEIISQNTRITPSREITLNTLNTELLRISARNPELLKMLKTDRTMTALFLRNTENLRRRAERFSLTRRFLEALTAEQTKLLERFIADEGFFFEERQRSAETHDLKFLLENSSERSLSEFFSALRTRLEEYASSTSEKSVFSSEREMREFFIGASRGEIARLIGRLEKEPGYSAETKTLETALRAYDAELERRREDAERRLAVNAELSEFENISERELRHLVNSSGFSEERFLDALKNSSELKKYFSDYAWENLRTESVTRRYFEYAARSYPNYPNAANGASGGDTASEKERFSEYLLNSGELKRKFSESVKSRFFGASPDVVSAFAEYLVNAVREDGQARYGGAVRQLVERTENILYREELNLNSKANAVFSLIHGAWESGSETLSERLSELYAAFTQSGGYDELFKLCAFIPKTDYKAVEEFFSAVFGIERFSERSAELLTRLRDIISRTSSYSSESTESFEYSEQSKSGEYTFLDALNALPGGYQRLSALSSSAASAKEKPAAESASTEYHEQTLEQSAATVVSAAFAEYLSGEVRRGEYLSELEERVGTVLANETASFEERISEASRLIHLTRDNTSADTRLSERLTRLAERIESIRPADMAALKKFFSEFFQNEAYSRYNENIRTLAESAERVIHDESADIREKAERSAELIFSAQSSENSSEITALFRSFGEKYSDSERLYELYSRLPKNDGEKLLSVLNSEGGKERVSTIVKHFSENSETLLERLREANGRDIDTDLTERIERLISAAYSEYLLTEIREGHYSERLGLLAERVSTVLRDESLDIRERSERAAELIYKVYGEGGENADNTESRELTRLYDRFAERYNDSERLLRLYSRLPNNDLENVSRALSSAAGEKRFSELIGRASERFFISEGSKLSDNVSRFSDKQTLIHAGTERGGLYRSSQTSEKSVDIGVQRLFSKENAKTLLSVLSSAFVTAPRRVYNFSLGVSAVYPELLEIMPRGLVFTLERGSVTRFAREERERTRDRATAFSRRREERFEKLSERTAERLSVSERFAERNSANELFYTDEYAQCVGGSGGSAVKFAIPAAVLPSGNSAEVSEKLGELRGAVENITSELEGVKRREDDFTREFVTKSEQKIFERELKNAIEQDIYLAGKRHGIL